MIIVLMAMQQKKLTLEENEQKIMSNKKYRLQKPTHNESYTLKSCECIVANQYPTK